MSWTTNGFNLFSIHCSIVPQYRCQPPLCGLYEPPPHYFVTPRMYVYCITRRRRMVLVSVYRVTHNGWELRDTCARIIQYFFLHPWVPTYSCSRGPYIQFSQGPYIQLSQVPYIQLSQGPYIVVPGSLHSCPRVPTYSCPGVPTYSCPMFPTYRCPRGPYI